MKLNPFLKTHALAIAAVLFAATTMSFKLAEEKANTDSTVYYYVSPSTAPNAFHNTSNWNTSNSDNVNCSIQRVRPCKITVPDGQSLSDILGAKSNDEVLDISEGFKPSAP